MLQIANSIWNKQEDNSEQGSAVAADGKKNSLIINQPVPKIMLYLDS